MAKHRRLVMCQCCGKEFYTYSGNACYCSDECRREMYMSYQAEYRESHRHDSKEVLKIPAKPIPYQTIEGDLGEISVQAHDANMSYGYYVGSKWCARNPVRRRF